MVSLQHHPFLNSHDGTSADYTSLMDQGMSTPRPDPTHAKRAGLELQPRRKEELLLTPLQLEIVPLFGLFEGL